MKRDINKFLNKYGRKDSPDTDESIVSLLMSNHFYYIKDKFNGFFIKEDIQNLTKDEEKIHIFLKENAES